VSCAARISSSVTSDCSSAVIMRLGKLLSVYKEME
jgi:hypothetical protein